MNVLVFEMKKYIIESLVAGAVYCIGLLVKDARPGHQFKAAGFYLISSVIFGLLFSLVMRLISKKDRQEIRQEMTYNTYGNDSNPSLLLIPGLGVSYEIFVPLIENLKDRFHIVAAGIDGFLIGEESAFTSVDDQAWQIIKYVQENLGGHLDVAYGLSLGGKILSRIMERGEIDIDHAILDAAPLLSLPKWLVNPLRYYQSLNVWTCYHWTGFWKRVFHSHYFDVLLDECQKVWPYGKGKAVRDGYKDVYTNKLESIQGADIHFWHGTKETFVAKPQAKHLCFLHPDTHVEVFPGMNHGQFLIDHPEEVAERITRIQHILD